MNVHLIRFLLVILAGVAPILQSCSTSKEKQLERINSLEQGLIKATVQDAGKANELIKAYTSYAANFAKDTLSPEFLYKAANLAISFNKVDEGITLFEKLITDFPQSRRAPEALFMQAFTYENVKKDMAAAGEYYNRFVLKYPTHYLADDARMMMKYLGNPDQMLRDFDAISRNDSMSKKSGVR